MQWLYLRIEPQAGRDGGVEESDEPVQIPSEIGRGGNAFPFISDCVPGRCLGPARALSGRGEVDSGEQIWRITGGSSQIETSLQQRWEATSELVRALYEAEVDAFTRGGEEVDEVVVQLG